MRTPIVVTVLLASALLAACDDAPMSPIAPTRAPRTQPAQILGVTTSWKAIHLPFYPTAINDAGVIVGFQYVAQTRQYQAVRWENGTLTVLPHSTSCDYSELAEAISPKGVIAGFGDGCGLVWTSPTAAPTTFYLTEASYWSNPAAVYDDGSMIGLATNLGVAYAFRWSATGGLVKPPSNSAEGTVSYLGATDAMKNAYGGSTTGLLVRWNASNMVAPLPVPLGADGGGWVLAGNPRGDVVAKDAGTGLRFESYASGATAFLGSLPSDPVGLNDAGRMIGTVHTGTVSQVWTSYSGAVTVFSPPDSAGAHAIAVNGCGSIVAQSGDGYSTPISNSGWLYIRSGITPVCDQTTATIAY